MWFMFFAVVGAGILSIDSANTVTQTLLNAASRLYPPVSSSFLLIHTVSVAPFNSMAW